MTAGDKLRDEWGRGDALALHAISDIVATRNQRSGFVPGESGGAEAGGCGSGAEVARPLDRVAFVLRSLKTQDELTTLRAVYGPRLVVIAAYSPKEKRTEHLAHLIESSRGTKDRAKWRRQPEELIERDEKEEQRRGQDVSGTFHQADFFLRGWDHEVARGEIQRLFELLFGSPFRTPTRDEHSQFMAAGAALRSSEFGRQVGAAVATENGSVISVGANEVPVAGGGAHWEEFGEGNRDFEIGDVDTNRQQFDDLAANLSDRIQTRLGVLVEAAGNEAPEAREALGAVSAQLKSDLPTELRIGGLKDLTEFGRAVHAEMSALLDAARRGVSVQDATLYTTTFPCHNCARHIVGAGIARVVFVEPYTKSRAERLHSDSIAIAEADPDDKKVAFDPFVGVAPRRYREIFDASAREQLGHLGRKDATGRKTTWSKRDAFPVFSDGGVAEFRPDPREYRARELLALEHFYRHHPPPDSVRAVVDP